MRTFLCVNLTGTIQRALERPRQVLVAAHGRKVRGVALENLHVTLCFLGEVNTDALAEIEAIGTEVAADMSSFEMRVAGVGAFPTPHRARVILTRITEGQNALIQLQNRLSEKLMAADLYTPDRHRFVPHITFARVRSGRLDISPLSAQFEDQVFGCQRVEGFQLMKSELHPSGPQYEQLRHFPFFDTSS